MNQKRPKTKPILNRHQLPIPDGENPEHFVLTGDSDSKPGANNFYRVLESLGVKYFVVPRSKTERRPDCYMQVGDLSIAAEVTDIEPSPFDRQVEALTLGELAPEDADKTLKAPSTFQKIKSKFKKKSGQFDNSPYTDMPALLVLYNTALTSYLSHFYVKTALFGHSPIDCERFNAPIEDASSWSGLFADSRQTGITGVVCLDNSTDASGLISFMGRTSMRLYLNPHAGKALPPLLLGKSVPTFWFDRKSNQVETNMENEHELWRTTF